jgi:predicted metal-dependent hydrolase
LPDAVQGRALFRLYRAEVRLATAELALGWERRVGRRAAGWRFRWMKSRWGSCNPQTGQITINIALAAFPRECLEQIVVHELTHLRVKAHDAKFYRLMDGYLPTWRAARAKLAGAPPPRPV